MKGFLGAPVGLRQRGLMVVILTCFVTGFVLGWLTGVL